MYYCIIIIIIIIIICLALHLQYRVYYITFLST